MHAELNDTSAHISVLMILSQLEEPGILVSRPACSCSLGCYPLQTGSQMIPPPHHAVKRSTIVAVLGGNLLPLLQAKCHGFLFCACGSGCGCQQITRDDHEAKKKDGLATSTWAVPGQRMYFCHPGCLLDWGRLG